MYHCIIFIQSSNVDCFFSPWLWQLCITANSEPNAFHIHINQLLIFFRLIVIFLSPVWILNYFNRFVPPNNTAFFFFCAHHDTAFWLNREAALNRAITPWPIVFVTKCLTEPITLQYLIVFSFRAHASVQRANEPREEYSADSFSLAVFRSQCLVVRSADQTASVPEEDPLSGTSFLAYEWSVHARLYSKHSAYNVCFPKNISNRHLSCVSGFWIHNSEVTSQLQC